MATVKNIRIRLHNGTDYDYLYPETNGSQVLLQNYTKATSVSAISASDNANVAIGKLEKRIETSKKPCRFVIGVSTAGWTTNDCDYLCDGTSDNVEINAAISALPSTGGEIIILDGTYNLTASIVVSKDCTTIRGNGSATVLKRGWNATVETDALLRVQGSSFITHIYNLRFDGNVSSYGNSQNYGLYMSGGYYSYIFNNHFYNSCGVGFFLGDSMLCTANNNCFYNNHNGALVSASSMVNLCNNHFVNNNNYGLGLSSVDNCKVNDNKFNSGSRGISISSSNNSTINGNTFDSCTIVGIGANTATKCNVFSSNTFTNMDLYGMQLQDSDQNSIVGNTFFRSSYTTGQQTIHLYTASNDYNIITGNNCYGKAPISDGGTGNTFSYNIS